MFKFHTLLLLVTLLIGSSANAQTTAKLNDLSWLSGCWQGQEGTALFEEIWSKPAGMSMIGLGRTVKDNRTISFEFMQFREENGTLAFLPQPQGGAQVRFPLKEFTTAKFTFENATHDFPQRVTYERKGTLLLATIEGTEKGKFLRQEFEMKKVACN